jgi:hypothetical protein
MDRVNICVDQDTFRDISYVAKSESKTLFAFANEWMSVVAKISTEGWSPSKLQGLCRSISLMKEMDVITLPSDFVDVLIAKQYASDKEELFKIVRNLGNEVASVVKMVALDLPQLGNLADEFLALLPLKRFNLSIDENGTTAKIVVVGAGRRKESTECALELLSSILNSYGYSITRSEVAVGTLRVWASNLQPS